MKRVKQLSLKFHNFLATTLMINDALVLKKYIFLNYEAFEIQIKKILTHLS